MRSTDVFVAVLVFVLGKYQRKSRATSTNYEHE